MTSRPSMPPARLVVTTVACAYVAFWAIEGMYDVVALAPPILRHRMALSFAARADGLTVDGVIAKLVGRLA